MGLRLLVLVEIVVERLPNGMMPRNLRAGQRLPLAFGSSVLDRAAKLGQVGADAGVAVDRLDRPVEEAVRMRRPPRRSPCGPWWSAGRPSCRIRGCWRRARPARRRTWSTFLSSSLVSSLLSGTRPAASAGAIGCSASGGSSFSLVAVWVAVVGSLAISKSSFCAWKRRGRVDGCPEPRKRHLHSVYYRNNTLSVQATPGRHRVSAR